MPIRWHDSVRTRIIAWAFIPTLLILGAVGAFTLYTYQRVTEALVMERNQELTRLVAAQISAEMVTYVNILDRLAMTKDIAGFVPPAQETALRWSMADLRVFDGGVVILDSTGRVTAADPRRPELVGQDWSGRSYVQQLLPGRANTFGSDIEADGPGGAPVVAVALPIRSEGHLVGVIVGMFLLEQSDYSSFYRSLFRFQVRPHSHMLLVDSRGRGIDRTFPERTGRDLSAEPAVRALLAGQSGALRTRGADGREIIASYAPVPDTTWGLVEEEDWGALVQVSAGYGRVLLLLLALGLALPPLLVAAGIRRITRPLAELTAAAGAMAQGRLDRRIAVRGSDELAALGAAFNRTAAELQDLYAGLERKVADRTKELATLNAVAAAVGRSLDLARVLGAALAEVCAALDVPAAAAYRVDEGERALVLAAQHGLSAGRALRLPLSAAQPLVEAGEPVTWTAAALPAGGLGDLARAEGWVAATGLPLSARGRLLGAIILGGPAFAEQEAGHRSLLAAIGRQVSIAADNARLYEQAEQAAAAAERQRLARELHDSVTQTLFAANLIAGVLPALWEADPALGRARLAELGRLTQGALAEMRVLLLELRPQAMAATPLSDLLRQLAEAAAGRAGVAVDAGLEEGIELPADVRVALFRIAQEALNNMARHARATRAWLTLRRLAGRPAGVELAVRDDGCGFDPAGVAAGHLGLPIMGERAQAVGAVLTISSQPGGGTEVRVTWRERAPRSGSPEGEG